MPTRKTSPPPETLTAALGILATRDTAAKRLAWILEQLPLVATHRPLRASFTFVLRLLQPPELAPRAAPTTPLAPDTFETVLATLRMGFARLAAGKPWLLPAPSAVVLHPAPQDAYPLTLVAPATEPERLTLAVAFLVRAAARPIRACADCGRFFLPVKRQAYCSIPCRQRVGNAKRPARRSAATSA
jgi:hypothetical protein